jgi:arabinogalactan oligomer/maltooligosaccharide transport system permease protein
MCLVDALAVYGVTTLAVQGYWAAAAVMVVGAVVINVAYFSRRAIPMKYLIPGLVFLFVYQVFVVLYTGYTACTNYGDSHNASKADAVDAILANHEVRLPGSPRYGLTVVRDGDRLGFLVTDPEGKVRLGFPGSPLQPVTATAQNADGTATAAADVTALSYPEILARQAEVTKLRVSLSDSAAEGSLRTTDGSNAYVYRTTMSYDASRDVLRDTATGRVYTESGRGAFVGPDGEEIQPGWKVGVGVKNFTRVLTDSRLRGPFLGVTVWTFAFAILTVLLTFSVGLGLAMTLDDRRVRGRRSYRSLLILPYAFPAFLSGLLWAALFNTDFGFINQVLLGGADIHWLTTPWLARACVLIVNVWLSTPYMFLISTGALQSIPDELAEAAQLDGARPWQLFRLIKLPLLLISLAPLLIASFAFNFNNFNTIYMLTGGGPRDFSAPVDVGATDLLISFIFKLAFGDNGTRQYGFACAVSILVFVIVATVSALSFRRTRALEELT